MAIMLTNDHFMLSLISLLFLVFIYLCYIPSLIPLLTFHVFVLTGMSAENLDSKKDINPSKSEIYAKSFAEIFRELVKNTS